MIYVYNFLHSYRLVNGFTMTTLLRQMPLFKPKDELSQFLVLIPIPEVLSKEVSRLKKEFRLKYGAFSSEHSKPHISVCSFLLLNYRTDDAFSLFRQRLEHVSSFELQVSDFDFFDDSKVIYAKVEASDTFDFITSELNRSRQELRIRKNYTASITPHITVAKGLDKSTFEQAKQEYLNKSLRASFTVSELQVLSYDFKARKYREYSRIGLGSKG